MSDTGSSAASATPSHTASGRTPMVHRHPMATTPATTACSSSARPSDVSNARDVNRLNDRLVSGRANTSPTVSTNTMRLATAQATAQRDASPTAVTDSPSTSSLLVGSRKTATSRNPVTATPDSRVRKDTAGSAQPTNRPGSGIPAGLGSGAPPPISRAATMTTSPIAKPVKASRDRWVTGGAVASRGPESGRSPAPPRPARERGSYRCTGRRTTQLAAHPAG